MNRVFFNHKPVGIHGSERAFLLEMHMHLIQHNRAIQVASILAVVTTALLSSGCSQSATKARQAMVQKCMDAGQSHKVCTCAMDELAKKYDIEDALAYEERWKTPLKTYQPDYAEALASCRDLK